MQADQTQQLYINVALHGLPLLRLLAQQTNSTSLTKNKHTLRDEQNPRATEVQLPEIKNEPECP